MDIEDCIETWTEGDIKDSYETYTKPDIDSNILADIEADIMAEAAVAIEADTTADVVAAVEAEVELVKAVSELLEAEVDVEPSAGDTVEIVVDVVTEPAVPDDLPVSTRLDDIEDEQRAQETRAVTTYTKRASLLERVRVLEGSNMRLRDSVGIERERIASVERRLGYVSEELRQIRLTHHYDRESFRRLETFMIRHHEYRP
ncbi:hypothetical protein Tco_1128812 [Tanacetum coccineum]